MPITRSAKKSLRVGLRRRDANRTTKQKINLTTKKATTETIPQIFSILDKAAKTGVIHRNKAARLKSHYAKMAETGQKPKTDKKVAKKTSAKKTAAKAKSQRAKVKSTAKK